MLETKALHVRHEDKAENPVSFHDNKNPTNVTLQRNKLFCSNVHEGEGQAKWLIPPCSDSLRVSTVSGEPGGVKAG